MRGPKRARDYGRSNFPKRLPGKSFLIVSEGEVTEVNYFEMIKTQLHSAGIDVKVCGKECDNDPKSVVLFAEKAYQASGGAKNGGFDHVVCVFDRDSHTTFDWALNRIERLNRAQRKDPPVFLAAWSDPSFELWVYLHFTYTRMACSTNSGYSGADAISSLIRKQAGFESFNKALSTSQLDKLWRNFNKAVKNGKMTLKEFRESRHRNPSTNVHEIVELLVKEK